MSEELEPTNEANEPTRYPWSLWLNGRPHRLAWQEDFDPDPTVFRSYAYAKARKAGLRLAILIEPTDDVVLQAYRPGQPRPLLPSAYRRKANGRLDRSAPATNAKPAERDPSRECRRCGARLTPASITAGECMKVDLSTLSLRAVHDADA